MSLQQDQGLFASVVVSGTQKVDYVEELRLDHIRDQLRTDEYLLVQNAQAYPG